MKHVVTFGELLLRLSAPGYQRLIQAESFDACYGGAEANVAVSLASLGIHSRFVTALPSHSIGQAAVNSLRRYGVDTSCIVRSGHRVGIYYLESGASQRSSKVIYDRSGSSLAEANAEDFAWDDIFDEADWFHFSGITPALSDRAASLCFDACDAAKRRGIPVSCDINYRSTLWPAEKAGLVLSQLLKRVDYVIASEDHAQKLFDIHPDARYITGDRLNRDGYSWLCEQLCNRFSLQGASITIRTTLSASDNHFSAMLYLNHEPYFSESFPIHIVDRVGGGDAYAAGLIYAMLLNAEPQKAVEFATAASVYKHAIPGDYNLATVDEIAALCNSQTIGRIER